MIPFRQSNPDPDGETSRRLAASHVEPARHHRADTIPVGAPHIEQAARTIALSMQALASAAQLGAASVRTVARYLYRFNTLPASPRWRRRYPTADALLDQLRTPLVAWAGDDVERTWSLVEDSDASTRWWIWTRAGQGIDPAAFNTVVTYKLYISPACDVLRDAFHVTLSTLTDSRALAFKLGRDLPGILRPDKLVVYFASRDDLGDVANRLRINLAGMPSQGVPFTAALTDDGLLSWGVDPIERSPAKDWKAAESWRTWLTSRLAAYLRDAAVTPERTVPVWTFALARLERDGIDAATFVAAPDRWIGFGQA